MSSDQTLTERIYKELYHAITHRELKPGQNLTLAMLKEQFNVSHTPIREALTRLSADGLVEYQTNKGMRVVEFSDTEIREIFQFTAELEALAVKFCSMSFTMAPLLHELEYIITEEETALETDDEPRWDAVAGRFHDLFYKYSQNRYLDEAAERMSARMELMSNVYSRVETYPDIHERHKGIYQAILAKDYDRAADLVRAHLQFSMMYALEDYRKSGRDTD